MKMIRNRKIEGSEAFLEFRGKGLKGAEPGWVTGTVIRWYGNISFLEEVKPEKGILVKEGQEMDIRDKVLVFEGGSGSTVGSYNLFNLRIYGNAPAAIVMRKADAIISIGCIMADIPLVHRLDEKGMDMLRSGIEAQVNSGMGLVRVPS